MFFCIFWPLGPFPERANIAKAHQKAFAGNINDLWKKEIDDEQFVVPPATFFAFASLLLRSLFAPTLSKYAVNTAEKRRKGEEKPCKL